MFEINGSHYVCTERKGCISLKDLRDITNECGDPCKALKVIRINGTVFLQVPNCICQKIECSATVGGN